MDDAGVSSYNHTGHVVADLERAQRFYEDVLGFTFWYELSPPDDATAQLLGLAPPLGMKAVYLTLDGFVLELMQFTAPGAASRHRDRSMDERGLTHVSISVEDIRATAAHAAAAGGEIVEGSDIGVAVFIRDPDGQLLELLPDGYGATRPPRP